MYPNTEKQDLISKLFANKKLLLLIIGGVVVLLLIIVTVLANSGDKNPGKVVAAQAHFAALAELTVEQAESLNSASLRDQNANISILLSGAANDLSAATAKQYGKTDPNGQTAAANAARLAEMQAALDEAVKTNTVDMEYKRQLAIEIERLEAQLAGLSHSGNRTIRALLIDISERLKSGREALEKVSL